MRDTGRDKGERERERPHTFWTRKERRRTLYKIEEERRNTPKTFSFDGNEDTPPMLQKGGNTPTIKE